MTLLVVVYSQVAPAAVPVNTANTANTDNSDNSDNSDSKAVRSPVSKTQPLTLEDVTANPPIDLKDPSNVNTKLEYDPETGVYQLVTR